MPVPLRRFSQNWLANDELAEFLGRHFAEVEMRGIGASDPVRRVFTERSRRIRWVMRLDPLGLRDKLPAGLVQWLFARFGHLVRRSGGGGGHDVTWRDFPVGPPDDDCLDLLALCRKPRPRS